MSGVEQSGRAGEKLRSAESAALPPDLRLQVSALGESPLEAQLSLEERAAPSTETLGARELLIKIHAAPIAWVDLMMLTGQYQQRPPIPYTPGLEYSGEVLATGVEARARFQPGARVIVDFLSAGPRSGGAYARWGGCARYGVAPLEAVHPIPKGLDFPEAATLMGAYETAYHCLIERGQLRAGERLLLHGASGATGLAALQIALAVGAEVVATGRSQAKLEQIKALGASVTLPLSAPSDPSAPYRLREALEAALGVGARADLCYDPIGGHLSVESLRALRFGGRHLVVGWTSTPKAGRRRAALNSAGVRGVTAPANQLPTHLILMKGISVLGCPMVISTQRDPALREPRLETLWRWLREGKLHPQLSHRYALSNYLMALEARWRGEVLGGCVLLPWSDDRISSSPKPS
ncbi:MAG: zinc-binding dehydrogenase [Myxococcota bacterium]|nr:zinc-binding dehydrogenase [Myxococcota bacterium]